MTDSPNRYLDTFPEWLRTLGSDALDMAQLLSSTSAPESAKRYVAGGLNYLFKSLDLIPDGIEDLGFLDDCFVLRVAAEMALAEHPALRNEAPALARLAADAKLIADLLGHDFKRLETYVRGLTRGAARGRTVDEVLDDQKILTTFLQEVSSWSASYSAPSFSRDEKNLVKLQSFLSTKLPAG